MASKWDFQGWATRHNVLCSDGRTIKENAFKDSDKKKVPLVYNHNHKEADNVLGHALLEYRKEGVYAYGKFNETPQGLNAKELVRNGDITALSIYANQLKQDKSKNVLHGNIRELSLVLAGANPGAYIDTVLIHSEDGVDTEEAVMYNNAEFEIVHSDDEEDKTNKDLTHQETDDKNKKPSEEEKKNMDKNKTIQQVFDTLNDEQKLMVEALVGAALEEKENENPEGDNKNMKHNAFDANGQDQLGNDVLTHDEFKAVLEDAKKGGSLADAFIAHSITNVDVLFPEAQALNQTPELISRDMDWVSKVMNAVSKSPFANVKSTAVNITAEQARAKGYVKGTQKVEEVISALRRKTTPTTIYKFQKMDRDDIIDITDFDVVVFIKAEMRVMLDEEIARAILLGDGRSNVDPDKVNPLNIRPVYGDDSVYTVSRILTHTAGTTDAQKAKKLIQDIIRARKLYKGSGNPSFYTTEDQLTEMLLLEDTNGRVIYDTIEKLQTALRVKEVVTVPVMEGVNRVVGDDQFNLLGLLVNLTDYNVGANKGGNINFFDDFDLNYNKMEYLIETRISGALKKPYSAISFEEKTAVVQG